MINKLKFKILAGFMLLASMLLVAGVISIAEFSRLTKSVDSLIEGSNKTIMAAESMLESLEREDSGILMLMLGQWDEGRSIMNAADSSFAVSLETARGNQTQEDVRYIETISNNYRIYKEKWKKPIVNTNKQGSIDWYENDIRKAFLDTKHAVNSLMILNQNNMHSEAYKLKEESRRAIMPGIVAIVAAFIFSLLLNFFITKLFISPLDKLTEAIRNFQLKDKKLPPTVHTNDELKKLEVEINVLLERLIRTMEK